MQSGTVHKNGVLIGVQYFLYFGVMGIYLPFFNLYCHNIGFSGFQIGLLSSLRSVVLVLFAIAWSRLADHFLIRRPLYIICNFASAVVWIFYLYTTDFMAVLTITICYGIFFSPIISFLEAFAMDVLEGQKKRYGRLRMWGSIAFIGVVLVIGKVIDMGSVRVILLLILMGMLLQAGVALTVPTSGRPRFAAPSAPKEQFFTRPMILFLACAFLMLVSHGAYYGFYSIHLQSLGYGKTFIGLTWALASGAEIVVMVKSERLFKRFKPEQVLLVSFLVAAVRWVIIAFIRHPALILMAQLLHALTYGAFHMASILYIDRLSPAASKTTGQAVNNAVTYGLGLMCGFFLSGILYQNLGVSALFLVSALIAFSGALLFKLADRSKA